MSILWRVILSLVVMTIGGFSLVDETNTLVQGKVLGWQLNPSDADYLLTHGVSSFANTLATLFHTFGFSIAALALAVIWWGPVKRTFASLSMLTAIGIGLSLFHPQPSYAYYADNDYAETFMILPNESAFWIPDVGDNKNSQVKFGSEDYYAASKIPAKRFDVTNHVKLPNSGFFANKYVSPGRLIKVDRAPVTREWVKASHRGTGKSDESFPCQSKEGIDVTTGVSIGTSVSEDNAAKFLYHFGVNPPKGEPNDPQVIFTSVYYGKSLAQVMDEKVRNKVQSLVCDQMTKHGLDDANAHAADMMKDIEKDVRAYLDSVGITLDFIGWADTFEFSNEVQGAIDRKYVAGAEAQIAQQMGPYVQTMQGLATADSLRKVGDKWNGQLPSQLSFWGDIGGLIKSIIPGAK